MAFGRKKKQDDEPEVPEVVEEPGREPELEVAETTGPYDSADLPEDDPTPRLDLGGIRVPAPEGVEIRVDVNPEGHVTSAVAFHRGSQMQMNAFAAPRREGIWDEVRAEIAQSLKEESGGAAEESDGPFGRELRARIPTGQGQHTPARFVGVDGPRWFLRGLITGPAATDPVQAGPLEAVFRGTVVVRGHEAMPPRDGIPLKLPHDAQQAMQEHAEQQADEEGRFQTGDDFNPFRRGPEITETR